MKLDKMVPSHTRTRTTSQIKYNADNMFLIANNRSNNGEAFTYSSVLFVRRETESYS